MSDNSSGASTAWQELERALDYKLLCTNVHTIKDVAMKTYSALIVGIVFTSVMQAGRAIR
jgi:hypothetical protein